MGNYSIFFRCRIQTYSYERDLLALGKFLVISSRCYAYADILRRSL